MYFIAFLGHFEVKILKKYVKFCENSQSTNILPQIWLKVQILSPAPAFFLDNIPLLFGQFPLTFLILDLIFPFS